MDEKLVMNDEAQQSGAGSTAKPRPMRLWPGLALVGAYWAFSFWIGRQGLPITTSFMSLAGAGLLLTLLFLIWWFTNGTIRWRDRLLLFTAAAVGTGAAIAASHETFGPVGILFTGLPVALTVWAVALACLRWFGAGVGRWGTVAAIGLTWLYFSLLRMDGISGDLKADIRWRWEPSAEDSYVAERMKEADRAAGAEQSADQATASPIEVGPGDWPAFRGPLRNGEVRGVEIATDWTKSPPELVWRERIGPAWSSMLIVGGRLFTQEQVGEREAVVCLDAETGRRLWSREDAVRFWDGQGGPGPRGTPAFADGLLYTQGATGLLNCLDAATGELKWSRNLVDDTEAPKPMWGFSSSPLVIGNVVITFAGGTQKRGLVAYRTNDGEPAWTAETGPISYSSPQPTTIDGQSQVLFLSDTGLISVEPESGKLLWQHEALGHGVWRATQPATIEPADVLIGSEDLGTVRLQVKHDGDEWIVDRTFDSKAMKPAYDDWVLHDGCAYGFDGGIFCCVDAATGKRNWKGGRYGHGQVLLLADQGLLLISSEAGEAVLVEATPKRHHELARFQAIEGKTWNHPALAQGCLYIRNDQEIACYRLPTASEPSNHQEVAAGNPTE